jgi:hypothetical protein
MSTHDTTHTHQRPVRWAVPALSVVIGVVYLVAGLVGDNVWFGIAGLLIMLGFGLVFVLAGQKSETVAGLMNRRDERINDLDLRASFFAGLMVLLAALVMFVIEIARGHDGSPYYQLGALGGVSYFVALLYQRFRR